MVKKRAVKKNRSFKNRIYSFFKSIEWDEKVLLILLLVFMGIVAIGNSSNMTAITGAAIDPGRMSDTIKSILGLITEGIAKPLFDFLSGNNEQVLFIKLAIAIIVYLFLAFGANLREKFAGKGNVIAVLISLIVIGFMPSNIIDTYIASVVPGYIVLVASFIIPFLMLYGMHRWRAESSAGHVMKAIIYFFIFLLVGQPVTGITIRGAGITEDIFGFAEVIMSVYALFMVVWEIIHAFGRYERPEAIERIRERGREWGRRREERGEARDELVAPARDVLDAMEDLI